MIFLNYKIQRMVTSIMTGNENILRDCGCDKELENEYIKLGESGKTVEQIIMLKRIRSSILDELHNCSKKIDSIDYVIRELAKEE